MVKTYDEWAKDYDKLSDKQKKTYYDSATLMANKGNQDYQSVLKYIEQYNSGASTKTSSTKTSSTKTTTSTATPTTTTNTTTQYVAPTANTGNRDYQNDSEERQMEIVRNLEDAYAKNPNNFSNWDTFASKFNYDYSGRSDVQRQVMKDWYEKKFGATASSDKTVTYSYFDQNNNQHITYSDGSTKIIPGSTVTQQGTQGQQTGRSADGKTYTFKEGYEPIYPEGEITSDRSTSIANEGKFQQKSDAYTYYEDSPTRYNEILGNLEDIYVSHPQFFTDRTTFDANFQLDQRSVGQQALMVEWFYNKKKQEKDLNAVSNLNDGQSVYDAVHGGGLTQDQLDLLKGTPQYDDYLTITKNTKDLAVINNDPSSLFVDNLPKTMEELVDMIMARFDNMDTYKPREYMKELYDTDYFYRVRDEYEDAEEDAKLWQARYDSIDADTRAELEGTGATKGYMQALIARRQNDMIPNLNNAYAKLQSKATNWQLRHQSVTDLYGSYVDEANYEIQKYNANINAFQTMWGVYKDVAQYDWDYKQQYRLMQLQESYNNPMLDSEDIDEAKRALKQTLQSYYDTYGPIIKRDINKVMEDVLAYAKKNNVSVAEALQKNFVDQLQSKPEYKELQKQYVMGREYLYQKPGTASSSSKSSTSSSSSTSGDGTGIDRESLFGNSQTWWGQTADVRDTSATDNEVLKIANEFKKQEGKQSGGSDVDFVNSYLQELGLSPDLGYDYDSKSAMINSDEARIGNIAIDPVRNTVGVITDINDETGMMRITTNENGKIKGYRTNAIDKYEYIDPSKAMSYMEYNGNMPGTEFKTKEGKIVRLNDMGYLDGLVPQYKEYNANGGISSSVAGLNETLDSMGVSGEEFRNQAQNYAKYGPEAKSYLNTIREEMNIIEYLYNNIDDYLYVDRLVGGDSARFYARYDNLINKMTLTYYTDLRKAGATFGSTTEGEWKLVGSATSSLVGYQDDIQRNRGNIKKDLGELWGVLRRIEKGLPAYQASQSSTNTSSSYQDDGSAGRF